MAQSADASNRTPPTGSGSINWIGSVRAMIRRLRASGSPALAVLATIAFVSSLGISIMLPLLPLYALSLGASPLQLGLMTSGFAVSNGLAQFVSGFLMDRYGARRFVVIGIGTYAAANLLIATAPTAVALIGFGGWITSYAPFVTTRLGWSTFDVGIIFTIFGLGDITLGPWLGHLADRTGRRRMAVLASIPIFLFGFIVFFGLPKPFFYAISFVTGAALTAYNASWFALLTNAVPAARRGRVFGVVSAVAQAGTVIGALGATAIWQLTDVGGGLLLSSTAALSAGLVLLLLPAEIRPAPSPAPRAPGASDIPASR